MNLQKVLEELIAKDGITITKLARETKVPHQTIHGWLTGRNPSNINHVRKVATYFNVSLFYLLYGEEDPASEKLTNQNLMKIFSGDVRVTIHKL